MLKLVAPGVAAAGVAMLRNARVVGPQGWVVAKGDTFLPDHSWYRDAVAECPIFKRGDLAVTERLSGVTLNLCTDWCTNYGHVVFDALARVDLFERSGYSWDDVTQVLVPDLSTSGKRAMAERCGIPLDKAVTLHADAVVSCDELIAPTFPGTRRNTPPWVAEFWQKLAPRSEQRGRRLYISRRGSARSVLNEEELAPVLHEFGFETIVSSEDAIADRYPEAEIVIGPHGAALTDILFCRPGSVLIELTPPGHVFPYYYTIADSVGMEYFSVLGRYPHADVENTMIADFRVSPQDLRTSIQSAELVLRGEVSATPRHSALPKSA
jgi:capsular polysaccharide biosynthesis protein